MLSALCYRSPVRLSVCLSVCLDQDRSAWRTLATKQSPSSKIRESKLWHIKEQFGRRLNLAATSVLGHVTAALASAVPELDSTTINKLTDDMRSFVFDGAVRSSVCLSTRMDQSKMVEVRVVKFSPYDSPVSLVLAGKFHPEILTGSPERGHRQTREGCAQQAIF